MAGKPYKHQKRGAGRFVQLPEWLQTSEAWATMKPGPRSLYVEIKRRYYGDNNGRIYLSHRDAAAALNVNRNTVGAWFQILQERGFIRLTHAPYLGPSGIGKASVWALEELPLDDAKPARKSFMSWRAKQNPRPKNRAPRPSERDSGAFPTANSGGRVLKFGTQ